MRRTKVDLSILNHYVQNTRLSTRMLDVEKHWRETTTGEGMNSPPVKVRR